MIYKGRKVRLIDTPGFDDSNPEHDDSFILKEIASWLVLAYSHQPPLLLSGIIYLHPINEVRMKGTSKNNLKMFRAMCGTEAMSCVVLATTMWKNVDESTGWDRQERISKDYWNNMVEAGSVVVKHDDTRQSALRIVDQIMSRKKQVSLKIQQQLVTEGKTVEQTNAGQELKSKVNEELAMVERRLQRTRTDLEKALAEQDNEAADDILEQQKKFEAEIQAKDAELRSLQIKTQELFQRRVEEMAKSEAEREKRQKEREEKIAEMKKELETVQDRQLQLRNTSNPPSYDEVALLSARNDMLQMELRRQENQRQIAQFEETKRLQIQQFEQADSIAERRHAEQMRRAKHGVVYGGIGAAAGVASAGAALSCTVM